MNKNFSFFILLILGAFLFLAGLGRELYLVRIMGLIVSGLLIVLAGIKRGKIKLPKAWWVYCLFLISLIISQKWSWNRFVSLHYFYLFLSGGMFWVASYNLKKELKKNFDKVILGLGLVFGGLFIHSYYFTNPKLGSQSLYLPYTRVAAYHNNIGDLWGVVGVVILFYLIKNSENVLNWLLMGLTSYLLLMSRSRSAFVSLGVSGWWLIDKLKKIGEKSKTVLLILVISLILITAQYKPLLFSRQYFFQAIASLLKYPGGIGLGSFASISRNPDFHIWGMSHFSSVVHNLILEIMSGIGWFGLIFVVWLVMVGKNALKGKSNFLYKAVWLSLIVNFMFHSCYRIPAMYWMWMILLGLC